MQYLKGTTKEMLLLQTELSARKEAGLALSIPPRMKPRKAGQSDESWGRAEHTLSFQEYEFGVVTDAYLTAKPAPKTGKPCAGGCGRLASVEARYLPGHDSGCYPSSGYAVGKKGKR